MLKLEFLGPSITPARIVKQSNPSECLFKAQEILALDELRSSIFPEVA
jgi:hypothetical protein